MLCNKDCYDKTWKEIISPIIARYAIVSWINVKENIQDDIWSYYKEFNMHCRETYMATGNKKLDRHKVAACYMFAILKTDPFIISKKDISEDMRIVATEHFAISVGLSILKSFLISKYDENDKEKSLEVWEKERKIFQNDFVFPCDDEIRHGDYRNNFAMELYFTKIEKTYNILSLSHSLYFLEMYNRQHWELSQHK